MNNSFFLGYPAEFKNICWIYPPKVKDVACTKEYSAYVHMLMISQEEIEDEYVRAGIEFDKLPNPFEYILSNAYNNLQFRILLEKAFDFFLHEKVIFLFEKKMIAIGDLKELKSIDKMRMLKEEDYFDFQNMLRESVGSKPVKPPNPNEDPRVKRIKAKARYRDYIKAKHGKGLTLQSTLASISCMGLGLNPLNIGELSYAAVPVLLATYQNKEKYELDVDSLLAGADSKKVHPVYWIRNLDE